MRIERNARRTQAKTTHESGNPGASAGGGAKSDLNPDFTDPDFTGPDLSEPTSRDRYQDQAPTSWLAAHAATPPEIRSERIAALQAAILNGTYQVSPDQIAEAILLERQTRGGTAA